MNNKNRKKSLFGASFIVIFMTFAVFSLIAIPFAAAAELEFTEGVTVGTDEVGGSASGVITSSQDISGGLSSEVGYSQPQSVQQQQLASLTEIPVFRFSLMTSAKIHFTQWEMPTLITFESVHPAANKTITDWWLPYDGYSGYDDGPYCRIPVNIDILGGNGVYISMANGQVSASDIFLGYNYLRITLICDSGNGLGCSFSIGSETYSLYSTYDNDRHLETTVQVPNGDYQMSFCIDGDGYYIGNEEHFGFIIEGIQVVPEPSTWAMLIGGLGLLLLLQRRSRLQTGERV